MFLYDKTDNAIDVYSMIPDERKIKKYRKKEIEKFSDLEFFHASMRGDFLLSYINNGGVVREEDLNYNSCFDDKFHEFKSQLILTNEKRHILNNFYNGYFDYNKIIKIKNVSLDKEKYLLFTDIFYKYLPITNTREMRNIVSIPETLYLLQMLLQGNFSFVKNKDIYDQLKQFNISKNPVQRFYISDLEKLDEIGLIEYDNTLENISTTQKILQKIR